MDCAATIIITLMMEAVCPEKKLGTQIPGCTALWAVKATDIFALSQIYWKDSLLCSLTMWKSK
jgi:hypothetical protein